ncbi:MAG: hypothetical protein QHH09_01735 [Microgenomates group bacterium]|nr:hypothetical protein [Microgenomates group bacterium]
MIINCQLPNEGEIVIKAGQKVDFKTPLFKKKTKKEKKIFLAEKIGVPAEKIFSYLKKIVGDKIKKGDLLAEKKTFLTEKKFFSDYDGLIKEINHLEGYLIIEEETEKEKIFYAYFQGKVEEIKDNQIKLVVKDGREFELKEAREDFGGEVFYYQEKIPTESLVEEQVAKKVIVAKNLTAYSQAKLEALEIAGFVTLLSLPEMTGRPAAKIKNLEDLNQIFRLKFPYCIISSIHRKIYFYQ